MRMRERKDDDDDVLSLKGQNNIRVNVWETLWWKNGWPPLWWRHNMNALVASEIWNPSFPLLLFLHFLQ